MDNPDHVAIVIHNYRWRQGQVDGEARYDALEQRLAETQAITVPASFRLIAKMPTIAAMAYKYTIGQSFIYPENDLDYASNFLRMCFAVPRERYEVNPLLARAMDRIFILYADHEQNASTSTVRLRGQSVRLHRGRHRLEWRLETEAFSRREISGEDDVLDFFVGHFVKVDLTRQPS